MPKQAATAGPIVALLLGLALSVVSQASLAASEDILLADPDTLEALGFARDAKNVYMAPEIDPEGVSRDPEPSVSKLDALTKSLASGRTGYASIWAKKFRSESDVTGSEWRYDNFNQFDLLVLRAEMGGQWAAAQIRDLPNGGDMQWIRAWWFDDDETKSLALQFLEVCKPPYSPASTTVTILAVIDSVGTPGEASDSEYLFDREIDTRRCTYVARALFPTPTQGASVALHKFRLQFRYP